MLNPAEHVLLRENVRVHLPRREFELLVVLVEHAGHLLRKDELLRRLWPDTVVEEGNLTKHVSLLRKALESDDTEPLIETIPRVGFRFICHVELDPAADAPVARAEPGASPPGPTSASSRLTFGLVLVATLLALGSAVALVEFREQRPASEPSWAAVAVLPFRTFEGAGEDSLGVGLADGIITRLSSQRLVAVRPTSAVTRYQRPGDRAAADIGRELKVDVVVDGHIQRARETVRVTVQLVQTDSGSTVWAETFDQTTGELFRFEDAIAERVAVALRLRFASAEQQRLRRRYTSNAAAYRAYVDGRDLLLRYTPATTRQSVAAFERALTLDPNYTLARAGLAMASADMYLRFAGSDDVQQWGARAEREARLAIELDSDLAEAHLARAAVFRKREFNWDETINASRRALALNPNLNQPRLFAAAAYYHIGLMDEAMAELARARSEDHDITEGIRIEALIALFTGRFDVARDRLETVSRQSSRAIGDTYLALARFYLGDSTGARRTLEQLAADESASTAARSRAALAGILAAAGERAAARNLLAAVESNKYRDHHVSYSVGAAFAQLGDVALATKWLQMAADTGFPCAAWYAVDPLLAPVRVDERFKTLMADLTARRTAVVDRYR